MTTKDAGSTIRTAYADLANIAREMWPVLLILSALYIVCAMAWFIAPLFVGSWLGRMIMRMLVYIGVGYLLVPYHIALHRFVATGEVRWIPRRDSYGASADVYLGWAGFTVALWFAPLILGEIVDAGLSALGSLVAITGFVVVWVFLVRLTTLLPAAALDPQRAGWRQAMADSRGKFWSYFLATTGPSVPAIFLLLVIGDAAVRHTITAVPFMVLAVVSLLAMQLIPLAVGTRLYLSTPREPVFPRTPEVTPRR